MKWALRHRTAYRYAAPVRDSFNEMRLRPPSNARQRLEQFHLTVKPTTLVEHYTDFYGNWVDHFHVVEAHSTLELETTAVVTTLAAVPTPWDARPATLEETRRASQLEPCLDFSIASRFIDIGPNISKTALEAIQGQTDAWQAAVAIMHFVHDTMTYEPNSTHVHTHARDALTERRGVCQDFAHIMIGLCRSVHIPARYVSGYLATQSASATHAWTEVYIPSLGWVGMDPTHDRQPDESYVMIGTGRDYNDVPPLRGTFRGTNQWAMEVEVEIKPLM